MGAQHLQAGGGRPGSLAAIDTGIHRRERRRNRLGHESAIAGRVASARWVVGRAGPWTAAVGTALLAAQPLADAHVGAADQSRGQRFTSGVEVADTPVMANRTGSADLPLHSGFVPPWLVTRMASLGRVIVEAIAHHYGRDELLRRLAHPFWFQSFGAVMGMDWHSSGITTSVIGALKRGLAPLAGELGLHVCGGRGKHSLKTPQELVTIGDRVGLDG